MDIKEQETLVNAGASVFQAKEKVLTALDDLRDGDFSQGGWALLQACDAMKQLAEINMKLDTVDKVLKEMQRRG